MPRARAVPPPKERQLEAPFFDDLHTHATITKIAGQETLVVYAGLGVTVDRTKKNWHGLIDGLLDAPALGLTEAQRKRVFTAAGGSAIAAASITYELFEDALVKPKAMPALQKRMRELLYPTTLISETGNLVGALGTLMDGWAKAGRTVVLVTPNYEDLLLELLQAMTPGPVSVVHVTTGTTEDDAKALLASTGIKYVYLHGSVPDNGPFVRPVLHERDYFETETAVRGFLRTLFANAPTLFVGTSLQDPPLVSALLAQTPAKQPRWALTPLQDQTWPRDPAERAEQVRYHGLRLRHLGVEGIYPDFFSQIAQFVYEVQECHRRGAAYESSSFGSRYGERLCRWWDDWDAKATPARQAAAHRALAKFLDDDLRHVLNAKEDEQLKVEIWLRWEPRSRRELGLWASSVGTWRSREIMRFAPLAPDSDNVAVNVFTQGRVIAPRLSKTGRWLAVGGVPLSYTEKHSAQVPIGAAVIASMQGSASGVLVDKSHSALLAAALEKLQEAADQIVRTAAYKP
jgi:hypothetical protein